MKEVLEKVVININVKLGLDEVKLVVFYNSYMDEVGCEVVGIKLLMLVFVSVDVVKSKFEFVVLMVEFCIKGGSLLFGYYVNNDVKNLSEYVMYVY